MNVNVYVYAMHVCVFYVHVYWDFKYMCVHFSILCLSVCPLSARLLLCPAVCLSGRLSVCLSLFFSLTSRKSANRSLSSAVLFLNAGYCQSRSIPSKSWKRRNTMASLANSSMFSLDLSMLDHASLSIVHPPTERTMFKSSLWSRREFILSGLWRIIHVLSY